MSAASFVDAYLGLDTKLDHLQKRLSQGDLETRECVLSGQALLQFWHAQLAEETGSLLPETLLYQWRSLHTEIHRELRLLNMDLIFLGRTRTAKTRAEKEKSIGDRLNRLSQYCQKIINLDAQDTPEA